MYKILSIAGSDSSGGAGIQADIKTVTALEMYAMTVVTAVTAQNTMGVQEVFEVPKDVIAAQMDSVFCDIVPDAVKTGMICSAGAVEKISAKLKSYSAKNIVVDPVMVSTSGAVLSDDLAVEAAKRHLFPMARVITPNVREAEILSGAEIKCKKDMEEAAKKLYNLYGCAVLVKGGHIPDDSSDYLYDDRGIWMEYKKIDNPNTHGTGCTLSAAIAANLAFGITLDRAVYRAKQYVTGAIEAKLDLGKGRGPLNHMYKLPNFDRGW
ncbi:MAG: bifunctional hydroxymethylpyrimidine kinase/phosphomethylpyrimidine kinase [Clostridia bacterium]|nr:bifunctional hydroxymethylpyrimidine kinase/phosphomethylpyrimidine kinase [Clostridia bacterium]